MASTPVRQFLVQRAPQHMLVKPCFSLTVSLSHQSASSYITPSHRRTVAPSHRRTVAPSNKHTGTPSHCHTVTLSHCHTVALTHCRTVTLSHHHTVTLAHWHTVTPFILLSHRHKTTINFTSEPWGKELMQIKHGLGEIRTHTHTLILISHRSSLPRPLSR